MTNDFVMVSAIVLGVIVLIGYLNERLFHLTYEISLLLGSIILGGVIALFHYIFKGTSLNEVLDTVRMLDVERFLLKGVLCFMLFAGACHMKLSQFHKNARPVCVMAFIVTGLGTVFYGFLFYGAACLLGLPFSLTESLMFGSIVAPTDPIAATSILKKFGFPKNTGFLMEAESLLNDGVGVALFVVLSGLVATQSGSDPEKLLTTLLQNAFGMDGLLMIMVREVFGAVLVCGVVFVITFFMFDRFKDEHLQIFLSLFAVSLVFTLCDQLGCSGPIACVLYGVLFFSMRGRREKQGRTWDLEGFDRFWDTVDSLLNSALYVILGLTFIRVHLMPHVLLYSGIAILCTLLARSTSVLAGSFMMGPIPDGFTRGGFTVLFTWGGLRGGLCIALAMETSTLLPTDSYYIVIACTYAIVFFTTVIQGLSMKSVYNKLHRNGG